MIETLRRISAEARDNIAKKRKIDDQAREEAQQTRLSERLEQIHNDALSQAKNGGEWLMVAKLDENSGFWGHHEREITPNELPYGDEQTLAQLLAEEGFTISAGWHSPGDDMGDPPPESVWCYWAISWSKKDAKHSR